jgi:hypothetical protein
VITPQYTTRIPILESAFPATQRLMKQIRQKGVAFKLPQINSTMSSTKATAGRRLIIVTGMRERERMRVVDIGGDLVKQKLAR